MTSDADDLDDLRADLAASVEVFIVVRWGSNHVRRQIGDLLDFDGLVETDVTELQEFGDAWTEDYAADVCIASEDAHILWSIVAVRPRSDRQYQLCSGEVFIPREVTTE